MNTGLKPSDEIIDIYKELKTSKIKGLIFTIDSSNQLHFEQKIEKGFEYKQLLDLLPQNEPRFIFYDFDFETDEVPPRKTNKLLMISWIPLTSKPRDRFTYSAAVQNVANQLGAVQKQIQADDVAGLDFENVRKICLK
jgi:hypothetical protein